MSYTSINAFVGPILIVTGLGNDADELQIQIDITEEDVLRNVLGDIIYSLFLADLDGNGNPQSQKFIDLLDGITTGDFTYQRDTTLEWADVLLEEDERDTVVGAKRPGLIRFTGLKPAFPQFIWYDYSVNKSTRVTGSGERNVNTENSTATTFGQNQSKTVPNYNRGITFYDEVLTWMSNYLVTTEKVNFISDLGFGVYAFTVNSTLYLEIGDFVEYNGESHEVTDVTANSWTTELSGPGLSLPLTDSVWNPFSADDWTPTRKEEINFLGL